MGSPLWPTVDGAEGHQLLMLNCTITSYVTPCSRNSTQLTVELLRKVGRCAEGISENKQYTNVDVARLFCLLLITAGSSCGGMLQVLGQDGVQSMGDTSYSILPRFRQAAPIRSMLGEQGGPEAAVPPCVVPC